MHPLDPIVSATLVSVDMLFNSAKRVPEEKLTWSPLDHGRTVLSQLQECAIAPHFYLVYLKPGYQSPFHGYEEASEYSKQFDTLEKCEMKCREMTAELAEAMRQVTPDRLSELHVMPWGQEMAISTIAGLHYWNNVYHLGQINYIQTLYGDREMF